MFKKVIEKIEKIFKYILSFIHIYEVEMKFKYFLHKL